MLFHYSSLDTTGERREGDIDAMTMEVAISSLQRRGFVVSSIAPANQKPLLQRNLAFFERVTNKDLVIISQQIATLFEAQVSALRIFKLLSSESDNDLLRRSLNEVTADLQGGSSISNALEKHPSIFSAFYVNMVRAGEESGKLDETFQYLAEYLSRAYEVSQKAKNALTYPAFVISVFLGVMILVLTVVIPQLATILLETGQDLPIYTRIVIGLSNFVVNFWLLIIVLILVFGFMLFRYSKTTEGTNIFAEMKLKVPVFGVLYEKLYLSRITDNFGTLLASGIPMIRTIELSAKVVDNKVYEEILLDVRDEVKGGGAVSGALEKHSEIPGIMVQMIKVGEETGEMSKILRTLASFYQREVNNAVDSIVSLIEPIMIVVLGLAVGILLGAVLLPIYDIASSI